MLAIAKSPHHVLHPIRRVEQSEEESFAEAVQFEAHHAFALAPHQLAPALFRDFDLRRSSASLDQQFPPGLVDANLDLTRRITRRRRSRVARTNHSARDLRSGIDKNQLLMLLTGDCPVLRIKRPF